MLISIVQINDKLGLKLKKNEVTLRNIRIILNVLTKEKLLEKLSIFNAKNNWFSVLNQLRSESIHRNK